MATTGLVVKQFAEVLGFPSPSPLNRMLQTLRNAGLAPMGRAGRTTQHGHYEISHLANLIMGLAGAPSDAAEAVELLRPLTFSHAMPQIHTEAVLTGDFGTVLEQLIKADPPYPAIPVAHGGFEFMFCLNPRRIAITYRLPNRPPPGMVTGGNISHGLVL